ncbi:MAG: NCS2 family nucleobase:cation symporter [Tenericutes bacterium]|nr:NCS2 family nucleobase:cation symporter [Mycoplasmatota bacterium]
MNQVNENGLVVGINERPKSIGKWIVLSLQHVFAMFGATVLVPILTGLPISVALVASGIGTLTYITVTKAKVPVYLGSSFAYIMAISLASTQSGVGAAYWGLVLVGLIYAVVAIIIHFVGKNWLDILLPPVVIGPMIMIIGLGLAPVAIGQAGLSPNSADGFFAFLATDWRNPLIAIFTFLVTIIVNLFFKGFLKIIPFIIGIVSGYVLSMILGVVDITTVFSGSAVSVPAFNFIWTYAPNFTALLMFAPIAFVTIAEHIGDHTVLGEICDKDFLKDPGLDKTLMGDGIATALSAMIGGPANTTYGENTGVVAMTKVGSVYVTGLAAVFAIILGFISPINEFIASIPAPVMGGISMVLFGLIAVNGLRVLVKHKVDVSKMRNLIIIATMMVFGLGQAEIIINPAVSLSGMAFAAVVGIILNQFINLMERVLKITP